jgi:hypothetical protein
MIKYDWKEKVKGWKKYKNGKKGFMMGEEKGVVRSLNDSKDIIYEYINVEKVINEIIVDEWNVGKKRKKKKCV